MVAGLRHAQHARSIGWNSRVCREVVLLARSLEFGGDRQPFEEGQIAVHDPIGVDATPATH